MYGRGYQSVRFGPPTTPNIIKVLMIINVGVFILQELFAGASIFFAATPALFWSEGYFWQPATYMWLHAPKSLAHIGFNMLALWMFGSPLASAWGDKRFLRFYLICGIGAGLFIVTWPAFPGWFGGPESPSYFRPTVGASGAVYGVLLAYSLTWPDRTIMLLFPPIPIKALYFIPFLFVMSYMFGPPNLSHVGHLGGVVIGWLLFRRHRGEGLLPSLSSLKYRWRRYRMRRNLRAVGDDDNPWQH